ncbi:sugar ABC transporter ATP-binding protein [Paraburkholderia sp. SIMBA_049]
MVLETAERVIVARNVSKAFPGIQALAGVDFELQAGEVHGLVGGNGAGKSTLIKVISGLIKPDTGTVETKVGADGKGGMATIHQELAIVPEMSAVSNVFLASPSSRLGFLNRRAMYGQYQEVSRRLGARIPPESRSGGLSVADQQLIEIMRALISERSAIIMDEPTASLGETERQNLFRIVKELSENGTAVIYIAHNLDEVLELCDRISVMRNGRLVESRSSSSWTKSELVHAMLGHQPQRPPRNVDKRETDTPPVLKVRGLKVTRHAPQISFDLQAGEILGIAGLVGSGRTQVLEAIAGVRPASDGRIHVGGREKPMPKSVRAALTEGIALAPEDRKRSGLVLSLPGHENILVTNARRVQRLGFVLQATATVMSAGICRSVGMSPERVNAATVTLSGGNQQKLVIGKWLPTRPAVLLLDEPTRGIDVGAKAEIFCTIRALCEQGMGAIVVSTEFEELVDNCDRVAVMAAGEIRGILSGAEISESRILGLIFENES